MTKSGSEKQRDELASKVALQLSTNGVQTILQAEAAAKPILVWLDYLINSEATGTCDDFPSAARSAIIEAVGCLGMGLARAAIFSLRAQVDIVLAWLYFKDHPVEWAAVQERGEGFMLKRDLLKYLSDYFPKYTQRFNALLSSRTRHEEDPYRLLSAHVHSQSGLVTPKHTKLSSLVASSDRVKEGVEMQAEVSEYLGDVLLSVFAPKWASLPSGVVTTVTTRLGPDNLSKVFS